MVLLKLLLSFKRLSFKRLFFLSSFILKLPRIFYTNICFGHSFLQAFFFYGKILYYEYNT